MTLWYNFPLNNKVNKAQISELSRLKIQNQSPKYSLSCKVIVEKGKNFTSWSNSNSMFIFFIYNIFFIVTGVIQISTGEGSGVVACFENSAQVFPLTQSWLKSLTI